MQPDVVSVFSPSNNVSSESQRITSILLEKLTHLAVHVCVCVSQFVPVSCRHHGHPAAFHAGPSGPTAAGAGGDGGGLPGSGDMEHRHV